MIRGYVAIVNGDSPLPDIFPRPDLYRKSEVKLLDDLSSPDTDDPQLIQFYISIQGTNYCFKVMQNIRTADTSNITSGVARLGFITPELDIVISCNPAELKVFVDTVKTVHNLTPKYKRSWNGRKCLCTLHQESQELETTLSSLQIDWSSGCYCCNHCTEEFSTQALERVSVTSYPFLSTIIASFNDLLTIPESLGLLPCLSHVYLSDNKLDDYSTNWNWLISPFMKENLLELDLSYNLLASFPEAIVELRNLTTLKLSGNRLCELPASLVELKHLSCLYLESNKLKILPSWMYRKQKFVELRIEDNQFNYVNKKLCVKQEDFETGRVPSMFETVAKFIIAEGFPFWQYNIPDTLADYLEGAYECRCGSTLFRDTVGRVVGCIIKTEAVATNCDLPMCYINIRCCSYNCYKIIENYLN